RSYSWPMYSRFVRDVGSFYANTGRLAAVAWAWATQEDASPNLYKIDVGTHGSSRNECLHRQWNMYYAMGIKYLRENTADEAKILGDKLEYVFGARLAFGLGTWQCKMNVETSTTYQPRFLRIPGQGLPREKMNSAVGLKPNGFSMNRKYIK